MRPMLWRVMAATVLAVALSQFHRAALAVVAPEVARDLGASPEMLGLANTAFFGALLLAQIPVGVALDRIGPRRSVAWLSLVAVFGAAGQALATDPYGLLVARFLLGLGCAASFMASVVVCARFFGGAALTTALSRTFALSQLGILFAAAPLAAAAEALGWRGALAASAVATAAGALTAAFWLRDRPPGAPPPARHESLAEALRGQLTIWRTPGLFPILSMHSVGYAAMATVVGIWAGPYLADAHGLDSRGRGLVLTTMALSLPLGLLAVGPLERRLNTRKWLVVACCAAAIAALALLAVIPRQPLWLAIALLVALCIASCYPVVVVAHGRSLFPDHLVGRGATTVNLAQVLGSAALPAIAGWVVGAFPADAAGLRPEQAYRLAFGALGLCLALGLGGYLFAHDARPRG